MNKQLIILGSSILLASLLSGWFWSTHYVQSPIKRLEFQCMVCGGHIVPLPTQKPLQKAQVSKIKASTDKVSADIVAQQLDPSDLEIAGYIKSKGWDYSIAIRLAKSENFWNLTKSFNCSRTHTNNDGSVDYGIFQINSIHKASLEKKGLTLEDMKDCYKNIDFAYEHVYKGSGWGAWSAFSNGSYLNHSEIEL